MNLKIFPVTNWNFFRINFFLLSKFNLKNSHQRYSVKKGVLRNFAKLKGKRLSQSLFFNKVADLWSATLLKKRLWRRYFPMNFAKFLREPFLQNTSGRLLLYLRGKKM